MGFRVGSWNRELIEKSSVSPKSSIGCTLMKVTGKVNMISAVGGEESPDVRRSEQGATRRSSICMRKSKHHDLARVTQHVTPQNQDYDTGLNDSQASRKFSSHRAFWRSGPHCSLCPDRLISFLPILMTSVSEDFGSYHFPYETFFWQPLGTITRPFLYVVSAAAVITGISTAVISLCCLLSFISLPLLDWVIWGQESDVIHACLSRAYT